MLGNKLSHPLNNHGHPYYTNLEIHFWFLKSQTSLSSNIDATLISLSFSSILECHINLYKAAL